jgi:hypothetical protein
VYWRLYPRHSWCSSLPSGASCCNALHCPFPLPDACACARSLTAFPSSNFVHPPAEPDLVPVTAAFLATAQTLVATAVPPCPVQVNVFFGSILTGSLFQQLRSFLAEPTKLPETLGNAIPSKSSFFITYIMVDGWAGFPAELLRLWPLLLYHIRVAFFVVTDRDRDNAMNVQRLQYEQIVSRAICI